MSEPQEPDQPDEPEVVQGEVVEPDLSKAIIAGVPGFATTEDRSAGVRCYFQWTVGVTSEAQLRATFGQLLEEAIKTFKMTNGQVLN